MCPRIILGSQAEIEEYEQQKEKALKRTDMSKLETWLKSVEPKMKQILESNFTQKAFDSYEPLW